MGVLFDFEKYVNNFKILFITDILENNHTIEDKIKLFFKNSNNITKTNIENLLFEKNKFDIIVCDIQNINCELIDIFQKINDIDTKATVIVVTQNINPDTMISLIDIGINQFIKLPLDTDELNHKLLKNCENVFYRKYYEKNESKNEIEKITKNLLNLIYQLNKCVEKIYIFKFNQTILENIIEILTSIVKEFKSIESFVNIGNVIEDLINFLKEIKIEYLTKVQLNTLKLLEFLFDDITRYLNNVFIYKDTLDVYYLEDSLQTSVFQLKQKMFNTELLEEELEIF